MEGTRAMSHQRVVVPLLRFVILLPEYDFYGLDLG
jgi:hypothetical protein